MKKTIGSWMLLGLTFGLNASAFDGPSSPEISVGQLLFSCVADATQSAPELLIEATGNPNLAQVTIDQVDPVSGGRLQVASIMTRVRRHPEGSLLLRVDELSHSSGRFSMVIYPGLQPSPEPFWSGELVNGEEGPANRALVCRHLAGILRE